MALLLFTTVAQVLIVRSTSLAVHQRSVSFFGTFLEKQESTDSLFDQQYVLRIRAYLLSLRPLGLVPASGLLWLLSKSPKLILIDGATLVTAPKKGPSAGTSVRHMLQMPLLVADQQVVNGCWSGDQQR